ncbi:hypothetical protein JTB14_001472 [Gonioctena quinquepunctata]|nr:hypothetical protein JTB14_001472 [Gonioctena quinquepunctata]
MLKKSFQLTGLCNEHVSEGPIDQKVINESVFKPDELENYKRKRMLAIEVSGPREQEAVTQPVESVASENYFPIQLL